MTHVSLSDPCLWTNSEVQVAVMHFRNIPSETEAQFKSLVILRTNSKVRPPYLWSTST
jgi:hypothetical protein